MALIKEWLPEFLIRHRSRLRPGDWPEPGGEDEREFLRPWFTAFLDIKVLEREADTASVRLATNPPAFAREHLPAVLLEIKALREANRVPAEVPEDRATAERLSRDCEDCGGGGFALIYHPRYTGDRFTQITDGNGRTLTVPARVVTQCVCPLGRWMRSKIRDTELLERLPDYERVRNGQHYWLPRPPHEGPRVEAGEYGDVDARGMQAGVVHAVGRGPSAEERRRREHRREAVPF